jgi:hypothetical protein
MISPLGQIKASTAVDFLYRSTYRKAARLSSRTRHGAAVIANAAWGSRHRERGMGHAVIVNAAWGMPSSRGVKRRGDLFLRLLRLRLAMTAGCHYERLPESAAIYPLRLLRCARNDSSPALFAYPFPQPQSRPGLRPWTFGQPSGGGLNWENGFPWERLQPRSHSHKHCRLCHKPCGSGFSREALPGLAMDYSRLKPLPQPGPLPLCHQSPLPSEKKSGAQGLRPWIPFYPCPAPGGIPATPAGLRPPARGPPSPPSAFLTADLREKQAGNPGGRRGCQA